MPTRSSNLFFTLILFLLWSVPAAAYDREDIPTALALDRAGERTTAIELYEQVLIEDRAALALPNGGLLPALLAAREAGAAGGDPGQRFRLAWLYDITGQVDRARELYAVLALQAPPEWAVRARENLDSLDREREAYERFRNRSRAGAASGANR